MNRRHVLSALGALTLTPILNGLDHRHAQKIIVAGFGASGQSVLDELRRFDNLGLLHPMMVETETEMEDVVDAVNDQRIIMVTQAFYPAAWKLLHRIMGQPNTRFNCTGYVIYPYLTASEIDQNLTHNQIPRWAYSYVDFVRRVNLTDANMSQSRWQFRCFHNDLTKVEKQVTNEIMKVQISGNWR